MFIVKWVDNNGAEIPKDAVEYNGYWYTDTSYMQYATGKGLRNGTIQKPGFSGSGETLELALKSLEGQIATNHSKNVKARAVKADKQIEETVVTFKKAAGLS